MENIRQSPIWQELAEKPITAELKRALNKLKNGKAGGSSGILPERVKAGGCTAAFMFYPYGSSSHSVGRASSPQGLVIETMPVRSHLV